MTGDKASTGNNEQHEARPHSHPHDTTAHAHDKTVSTHGPAGEHRALIDSLTHTDWQVHHGAAKAPAKAEAAHLPQTEITGIRSNAHKEIKPDSQTLLHSGTQSVAHSDRQKDVPADAHAVVHKGAPADSHTDLHKGAAPDAHAALQKKTQIDPHIDHALQMRALQHDVLDRAKDANQRLGAAHKLLANSTSEILDKDEYGKPLHLHIAETKSGKDTHIVISQIDGKTVRTFLEGTVDATGKVITAMSASPAIESLAPTVSHHPSQQIGHQSAHHSVHHLDSEPRPEHEHVHRPRAHRAVEENRIQGADYPQVSQQRNAQGHDQSNMSHNDQANVPANDLSSVQPNSLSNSRPHDFSNGQGDTQPNSQLIAPSDINEMFDQAQTSTGAATDKMIKLSDGSVYLRTHLMVDADGGSDWNIDRFGQSGTSLRNADGRPLDAKHVNYFVLPMGEQWKRMGIKLGDVAWVRNAANGKIVPAVFGDEGPRNKIGEGSQGLCRALGLSDNPNHGGTDQKNIEFLIVPHSGTGKGDIAKDPTQMVARLNSQPASGYVA
jgi:hypothetical protein